jgi:glycosyltransferase involved in cell wall biosynthesis
VLVLDDYSQDEETLKVLEEFSDRVTIYKHKLQGDFSEHRNWVHQFCKGDYIIMLDADELVSEVFMNTIHEIIENNPDVDLYYLPRINIVQGLTPEYAAQCGWTVNEQHMIQFPDRQGRIYKNSPSIQWVGKVHEVISGTTYHTTLPYLDDTGKIVPDYALLHIKSIERQQSQNEKYSKM